MGRENHSLFRSWDRASEWRTKIVIAWLTSYLTLLFLILHLVFATTPFSIAARYSLLLVAFLFFIFLLFVSTPLLIPCQNLRLPSLVLSGSPTVRLQLPLLCASNAPHSPSLTSPLRTILNPTTNPLLALRLKPIRSSRAAGVAG